MILKGNARGGAKDLALHLMKPENDHVAVHELRGFMAEDLVGALQESFAISRGTKCRQFLYSLSLNPPKDAHVPADDFVAAIDKVENELGLTGQPRAIVFHEKEGRRHCHAVWSRIDVEHMRAVQLSFDRQKLQSISKELYREHGWQMPRGLANASERDPLNFSLEEWQQAKRIGKDPKAIKAAFQDAWAISDSKLAFEHALKERGFYLARGDRRGFVAVDCVTDEIFAIPRWADVKTKDVRDRLGDEDALPSIAQTREQIASGLLPKLQSFREQISAKEDFAQAEHARRKADLVERQRAERAAQDMALQLRAEAEARERQARFRKGLAGLWDRLRGTHRTTAERNAAETGQAIVRDAAEKQAVISRQLTERQALDAERRRRQDELKHQGQEIAQDVARLQGQIVRPKPDQSYGNAAARSNSRASTPSEAADRKARPADPKPKSPEPPRAMNATPRAQTPATEPKPSEAFAKAAAPDADKAARREAFLQRRRSEASPPRDRNPEPKR